MIFKIKGFLNVMITLCVIVTLLPLGNITASAASYGTFNVLSFRNVFIIRRTGGTDGIQKVYYRTVSQSAIEDTHYKAADGVIIFEHGEDSKSVTIEEYGTTPSQIYGGRHSTGYSNTARTYKFEIYQITGGAALGDSASTIRTIVVPTYIDETIFTGYTKTIKEEESLRGDWNSDKLGWSNSLEKIGSAAYEEINVIDALPCSPYWEEVAEHIAFSVGVDIKEKNDGYQHIILSEGATFAPGIYPNGGDFKYMSDGRDITSLNAGNLGGVFFARVIEHGSTDTKTEYDSYTINTADGVVDLNYKSSKDNSFRIGKKTDGHIVVKDDTLLVGFSGSGSGGDEFYTKNLKLTNWKAIDTTPPKVLGIAPVSGNFRPGDELTLSVVFDEIISNNDSSPSTSYLDTSWGDFTYSGGVNTNVLYYTGTVSENAVNGKNTLSFYIENSSCIRDIINNIGSHAGMRFDTNVYVSYYDAELNGTNATKGTGFGTGTAWYGSDWTGYISAASSYALPASVTVIVDGFTLAADFYTYDREKGTITIPGEYITGKIEVTADGIKNPVTVTGEVKGSGASYEYSFDMVSPDNVNGTFIVALYGTDNRLVGIETIEMNTNGQTYSATNTILTDSPANTYKIMFWSGPDTLKPLCEVAEGNIVK